MMLHTCYIHFYTQKEWRLNAGFCGFETFVDRIRKLHLKFLYHGSLHPETVNVFKLGLKTSRASHLASTFHKTHLTGVPHALDENVPKNSVAFWPLTTMLCWPVRSTTRASFIEVLSSYLVEDCTSLFGKVSFPDRLCQVPTPVWTASQWHPCFPLHLPSVRHLTSCERWARWGLGESSNVRLRNLWDEF